MSKSNAEIAREEMPSRDVRSILALVQSVVDREVATAQSDLARQVLEEIEACRSKPPASSMEYMEIEKYLRDLFTRLGIDIT